MQTNFSILFYMRKKIKNTSIGLIYVRITVDGIRSEFSTTKKCDETQWNSKAGKMIGTKEEAKTVNLFLDTIKARIFEIHRQMILNGEKISAEAIRNKYQGKTDRQRMLMEIFQDHNDRMETLLHDEFSPGTLERYKTSYKHTFDFLQWKFNISDIEITKIDYAFITDYEYYLRTVRKCNNNTAVKYIKNFNKIIRICLKNDWLKKNPFVQYKPKIKEVIRVFLTEEEIQAIMNKEFRSDRLNQVKDVFLFSCFTGLAYIDVKNLRKMDISTIINGEKWIMTQRQKTDTPCNIPLLPPAEALINKYIDHPSCIANDTLLPIVSNQKTNEYLKEIAAMCDINKELTFHIARHTFATTVTLTNGVSIESVSKMLGHKNLKTTQHYAKILDKKVGDDMNLLRGKYISKTEFKDSSVS